MGSREEGASVGCGNQRRIVVSPPGAGLQQGTHRSLMGAATPWVCKRDMQSGFLVRQRVGVCTGRDIRLGDDVNWGLLMLSISSVKKRKNRHLVGAENTDTPAGMVPPGLQRGSAHAGGTLPAPTITARSCCSLQPARQDRSPARPGRWPPAWRADAD